MSVVTRFAPSPTGFLHIGGARTALFNWLFARHHGGTFLLRIEDTDRARSTEAAKQAILDGLKWLELDWDGDAFYQSERLERHAAVARELLATGKAYHCYCTPDELAEMRRQAKAEGRYGGYDGRWRDRDPSEAPPGAAPAVRFKAPREGETLIDDRVQGEVRIPNGQLDDMVLLRADGTPTYMLSVVVDDHDMDVSHVLRGDDHLVNAARQSQLFHALEWAVPEFAHVPLIHGPDGAKLSKRHGALGVEAYREMGYLPEALRNYLLRLGWSHGDDEIIGTEEAIAWFNLSAIGRGPARFDFDRLENLNGHYIREADDARLIALIRPALEEARGGALEEGLMERLSRAIFEIKQRAKTTVELIDKSTFIVAKRPLEPDRAAAKLLDDEARRRLADLHASLSPLDDWSSAALERAVRDFAQRAGLKLGKIAQPLRAALTGRTASPGIFDVLLALGREESLGRIDDAVRRP